jgi:hypothetical protein
MRTPWRALLLAASVALSACGGSSGGAPPPPPQQVVLPAADVSLLFMGNSHTSTHNLPGMVEAMVRSVRPGQTVLAVDAPGWMFLEDRARDAASLQLLRQRKWSVVVLQAQKYSTSQQFDYSTAGAEALVRAARAQQALPVLFPEWPRLGVPETQFIFDIHAKIARREPACVAPVGQAWDIAASRHPELVLHASDGNHSAPAGAFLAALVIAATITRVDPDHLPFITGFDVDAAKQETLRRVAMDALATTTPRQFCPLDP